MEVLLLLRHWSPQKEQLQQEGSLCVLGVPPWSFPPHPRQEGVGLSPLQVPFSSLLSWLPPTPMPWP